MKAPCLLLLLFLLTATTSTAQHQFYYKDVFDKNIGLTATPTCMVEDGDGFFWIGTAKGLFRFDGSLAREIRFIPDDSLADNNRNISSLAIDNPNSILWLATGNGVFIYYWRTGISEHLTAEKFFSKKDYKFPSCTKIFRDRQGEIWANFAAPGLTHLKNGGKSAERFTCETVQTPIAEKPGWAKVNSIMCFAQDALQDSIIWAGTRAGLVRFNKATGNIRHYYFFHPDKWVVAITNPIQSILAHTDGKLYLGSYNGGLLVFDPATERFSHHLVHAEASTEKARENNVDFIFPYSATQVCVTRSNEVLLFDTQTHQFTQIVRSGSISFIDKAGNFWDFIGSGLILYHHSKNQIRRLEFPDDPQFKTTEIARVWEDTATHTIYVQAGGLTGLPAYDRRRQQWKMLRFPTDPSLILRGHVLEKTVDGMLANDNERFYLLPPGESKFRSFPLTMPGNPGWMFSQKAPDGSVFISAGKGYLFWLSPGTRDVQTFFRADIGEPFPEHFTNPTISGFDAQGRPWISCDGGFSIFVPAEHRFIHIPIRQHRELHFEEYRGFNLDRQGRMWCLGMNDIGWIDPEHPEQGLQRRYGQSNGFALKELAGLLDLDRNGMFWFKSNDNLARFDPQNLKLTLFEGLGKELTQVLDGGELAFQNVKGIGLMHPDSMRPDTERPRPYVAWFKVFENEKMLAGDLLAPPEIRLQPGENFFSVGFSALGFFNPQKFRFAYQLEGVDRDWVYPERGIRFASYTGVKGGDYVFRLKVANGLGVWNETPFEWHIHVGTPWWATWWFRLFVIVVIAAAVYFLLNNRLQQQQMLIENQRLQFEQERSLRNERDRIAAEMHDDLGAGLSTIRFLSLLAKEKENDPVKSDRIDKIARSAAEVMERMADIIWVMNSRNDTLENFANYFRRYAGDYLDMHGIRLFFEMPDAMPLVNLSGERRRTLLLAMKECLHNVVKHAAATEVRLNLSVDEHLEITIADNGSGVSSAVLDQAKSGDKELTGNGLYNLHKRMEALGGAAIIKNQGGTTVVLRTGILIQKVLQ